ncbi:MAG: hypothetical protein JXR97_15705, partial [Planctomycetes bacterium]|nr:hypothetical protein [Planctomycetota bacterium]
INFEASSALNGPLVHILRNALDHGIEDEETRNSAGKPGEGTVELSAIEKDSRLVVTVKDDGKGLDAEGLKASAVLKGLITDAEAATMSEDEACKLIFRPGFSTAEKVTDVSGRGVGMDAVLTDIGNLGGKVDVESTKGKGTTIRITVPLN